MQRWEYLFVKFHPELDKVAETGGIRYDWKRPDCTSAQLYANQLGSEGWELAAALPATGSDGLCCMIFKRLAQ